MQQSRQLAAIMFTDIVGYTALMDLDEKKAYVLLDKNRKLQKPVIEEYNGRWIKELGDGVMASFPTASDAVNAAIKIQEACIAASDFQLRIGLHQGEVIFEKDDVFGNAVNIAARIQAAASPGCIFVSETVHHNISNKTEIETRFVKEEILKNVSQPVRMYQVMFAGSEIITSEIPPIPVKEKSIAVLPFMNMSSDPEQEYFSDGISEEIINVLAQVPGLKVAGRTSSFAFKGKNLDLKWIGEQLKVGYLLEGSVRRSGNTLRITAQLVNVADGYHLYSEKFDRVLKDIFAIQDELSLAILNAVKIKLLGSEREAVLKRYTDNVEAYQVYLQGRYHQNKYTPDGFKKAIDYFKAAIAIDSTYALAYSGMSFSHLTLWYWQWSTAEESLPQTLDFAHKSIALDDNIAESHIAIGRVKLHYEWKVAEAEAEFKKALAINPNSAECHVQLSMCGALLGNKMEAMEHSRIAVSLEPFSVMTLWMATVAPYSLGDMETTLENGKRIIDLDSTFFAGHWWVGNASIQSGRHQEGIEALQLAAQLEKGALTLSSLGVIYGFMGDTLKALEVIKQLESMEGIQLGGNNFIGDVYASIGELDRAFGYYDKAVDIQEGFMLWKKYVLLSIPAFQQDPRTPKLLDRIGVPY